MRRFRDEKEAGLSGNTDASSALCPRDKTRKCPKIPKASGIEDNMLSSKSKILRNLTLVMEGGRACSMLPDKSRCVHDAKELMRSGRIRN